MKQSELAQIKSFIAYIHTKYPPDGNVVHEALVEVENYICTMVDKTTKADGRASAWTDERREKMGASVAAKAIERRNAKAQTKIDSDKIWLWDYAGEPPTSMSRVAVAALLNTTVATITKHLVKDGEAVLPMPKQLRSVCITLTDDNYAMVCAMSNVDKELQPRPYIKTKR